jgi:DNA-binding NarL/FixJ family response regulator
MAAPARLVTNARVIRVALSRARVLARRLGLKYPPQEDRVDMEVLLAEVDTLGLEADDLVGERLDVKDLGLTDRQMEILAELGQGSSNAEIGRKLYLSEQTVKNYVGQIFDVLHVENRTQAAIVWLRQ